MPLSSNLMNGKVCMVTGSNTGIGKATALELAKMGATVIMVTRENVPEEPSPLETQAEIQKVSQNNHVDLLFADLSLQQSIHQLVQDFKKKYDKLHVLVNNAGVLSKKRILTQEGLELQLAVNTLAPFLLTNLLLDVLKTNAPSRIVNLTSTMHRFAKIDFKNLQGERRYKNHPIYNQTKLGVVLLTYELARRLERTGVTANCLHPGKVSTEISRELPRFIRLITKLFFMPPSKGAATSIYLASSPEVEGVSGKYFSERKEARSSKLSHDQQLASRFWDVCCQLTGFKTGPDTKDDVLDA